MMHFVKWRMCNDVYNIYIRKTYTYIDGVRDSFNINFGTYIGFALGLSYVYTGKPLVNNLLKK